MSYFNEERAAKLLPLYDYHKHYQSFSDDEATSSNTRMSIHRDYLRAEKPLMEEYFGNDPNYP